MSSTRRLSVLIIPLLVTGVVTTVLVDPASASVPGRETVSNSTTGPSATVSCTGDRWLLSSGVDVEGDGRRYVIVDELIPTLNSVTAYAHEYEYGTGESWSLRVWAVCADPSGTHRTSSESTASNSDNKGATVHCADDLVVSGVGWEIEGDAGQILVESAVPTTSTVTVDAYEVDAGGSGEYFGTWSVRAYATCVSRPTGYEILSTLSTSTSDEKLGHADCSTGKRELGGGFSVSGPRGRINTVALLPALTSALTYAHEVVPTTNLWPIRSYAICASQ